jgi:hypothetical protein
VEPEATVTADLHREHVLHADRDAGPGRVLGQLVLHPPAIPDLPLVGRVDDDERDVGLLGHLGGAVDLPDRVGPPDSPGQEEEGGVDGPHGQPELVRQLPDRPGVLGGGVGGDHDLDRLEACLPGVSERVSEREAEERSR